MADALPRKESSSSHDVESGSLRKENPAVVYQTAAELDAHMGVKKVEAAEKVYGKYSKWALFIS
jgi:hypothetical protein